MSGKKGMKKYPEGIREVVVRRIRNGESQRAMSREYGISRHAIQEWLQLQQGVLPKTRGRKPAKTLQEYKYENKRLRMEVELLRDFLQRTERK